MYCLMQSLPHSMRKPCIVPLTCEAVEPQKVICPRSPSQWMVVSRFELGLLDQSPCPLMPWRRPPDLMFQIPHLHSFSNPKLPSDPIIPKKQPLGVNSDLHITGDITWVSLWVLCPFSLGHTSLLFPATSLPAPSPAPISSILLNPSI